MSAADAKAELKPCVLYIEDEESNRALMERIATRHGGVRLLTAVNGREGLSLASSALPSIVLCDGDLPDMTAEDVVRQLREKPETREVTVVIISGSPASARGRPAEQLTHLMKPINVKEILALFDELGA
jgi:CheY-like chemotaxis protein